MQNSRAKREVWNIVESARTMLNISTWVLYCKELYQIQVIVKLVRTEVVSARWIQRFVEFLQQFNFNNLLRLFIAFL